MAGDHKGSPLQKPLPIDEAWEIDLLCRCHFVEHAPYLCQRTNRGGQRVEHQCLHRCLTIFVEKRLHQQVVNHHMCAVERAKLRWKAAKLERLDAVRLNQAGSLYTP